jgi:hypothetical protein
VFLGDHEHPWIKYHYVPVHSAIIARSTMGFDSLGFFQPVCFHPRIADEYIPDLHGRVLRPWLFAKSADGVVVCFIQFLHDLVKDAPDELKEFSKRFIMLPPSTIDLTYVVKYGKIGWKKTGPVSIDSARKRHQEYKADVGERFQCTWLVKESTRIGEGGVGGDRFPHLETDEDGNVTMTSAIDLG